MIRTKQLTTRLATAALVLNAVFAIAFVPVAQAQTRGEEPIVKIHTDGPAGTPCDSEKALPCDRTPAHLVGLPDPTSWSVIGRGQGETYYRRATNKERDDNGWDVGAFIVAGPGQAAAMRGARRATFVVPFADLNAQEINFIFDERVEGLKFFERKPVLNSPNNEVESRVLKPVLFEYFNDGFNPRKRGFSKDAWAQMNSSDLGGIYASGVAGGFAFEIDSPNGRWRLERIPAPGGFQANPDDVVKVQVLSLGTFGSTQYGNCAGGWNAPGCDWFCTEMVGVPCDNNPHLNPDSAAIANCIDHFDNDQDGTVDNGDLDCSGIPHWCDASHPGIPLRKWESGNSFALFGEAKFCTEFAGTVGNLGNWVNRMTAYGWRTEELMNDAIGFQGVSSPEKQVRYLAAGCWVFPSKTAATNCSANGSQCLNGYPYAAANGAADSYWSSVWDDVDHATYVGLDDALHMAQVVYWGKEQDMTCDTEEGCCGEAITTNTPSLLGSSVVQYRNYSGGCWEQHAPISAAHEFGHLAGLEHSDHGFMTDPAQPSPDLTAPQKATLVQCVSDATCPRPSGFRLEPPPWP